jgi:hypothetical protein
MYFRKSFFQFLSIIVLLVFAWLFLFFNQAILAENANNNTLHIPDNASFALRIDGRELAEKSLFSVFLESKDEVVISLLQQSISKNLKNEGQFKNYGIDYLSDIVLFELPFKNTIIQGILVNVNNKQLFNKNLNGSKSVFACHDDVGVIFNYSSFKDQISTSELKKIADNIVKTSSNNASGKFIAHHGPGKFIETFSRGSYFSKSSYFSKTNALFALQENSLILSGKLTINSNNTTPILPLTKIIEPKGIHVSSTIIPTVLVDSLNGWLTQFSLKVPPINTISLNLIETKIINHSSGFFVIPQIELVIQFDKDFSILELLSSPELITFLDYSLQKNHISFQEEKLFFKQINSKSIYIGITENPTFKSVSSNEVVKIEGNLKALTSIKGGGMMTAFLEMMPIYSASKNLAKHTESLNLSFVKKNKNNIDLKGELKFTKDHYPMNELIKFLLVGQIFN